MTQFTDFAVVEVHQPSRQLMCGSRPLADETLTDFIERVIMRLPYRQRPRRWAEVRIAQNYMEPSYVRTPIDLSGIVFPRVEQY